MRVIKYESDKMLPEEIANQIELMQERILSSYLETDKTICSIGNLKGYLVRWFAEKQEE